MIKINVFYCFIEISKNDVINVKLLYSFVDLIHLTNRLRNKDDNLIHIRRISTQKYS